MQGEALFEAKKRLSRLEKGVSLILLKSLPKPPEGGDVFSKSLSLHQRNALFVLRMPFPNLLPLGSPLLSEGLGEAFPFGEGMGVRL